MKENPLLVLEGFGQSIWLDFISRGIIASGELRKLIDEDGLSGVTSNPAIFEKAIVGSHDYDRPIRGLALEGRSTAEIYRTIVIDDIRHAADLFRPTYERTAGRDGFVSLEVSPRLARDPGATIAEARALWAEVDRPNLLVKVPGTQDGVPAVRQLLEEGINVNVTLLFGLPRYRAVAEAYLAALEARAARNLPLERVASVASFFLSRIDVRVDPLLEEIEERGRSRAKMAAAIQGKVAISSARMAYQTYKQVFGGPRFQELVGRGARPQRLLWASTGTKNPDYSDVMYVEALIGPDTVNTLPLETFDAYRDHGLPASRLEENLDEARTVLGQLPELGIDLDFVTRRLEDDGIGKFTDPFEILMRRLEDARRAALGKPAGLPSQDAPLAAMPSPAR
jgi:transaldolase